MCVALSVPVFKMSCKPVIIYEKRFTLNSIFKFELLLPQQALTGEALITQVYFCCHKTHVQTVIIGLLCAFVH